MYDMRTIKCFVCWIFVLITIKYCVTYLIVRIPGIDVYYIVHHLVRLYYRISEITIHVITKTIYTSGSTWGGGTHRFWIFKIFYGTGCFRCSPTAHAQRAARWARACASLTVAALIHSGCSWRSTSLEPFWERAIWCPFSFTTSGRRFYFPTCVGIPLSRFWVSSWL